MKKVYLAVIGLCVCGMIAPVATYAKGKKNKAPAPSVQSEVYAHFDANADTKLDDAEKDVIRKEYAKDANGSLKAYDLNTDGKLSDEEISAIPATKPGDAPAKKGKKKK